MLLTIAAAALAGLFAGSILNAAAVRVPRREAVFRNLWRCLHCGRRSWASGFVPVLGYMAAKGRCPHCGSRIPPAFPAGELVTAGAFAVTAWRTGWTPELAAGLLLASVLIVAAHSDLRTMLIPDRIVRFSLAAGLAARILSHPLPWWDYLLGCAAGAGVMLLLALVSRGGMGGGDIKLYLFVGLMLGFKLTILSVFASSLLGSLYGAGLLLAGRYRRGMLVPFGPFIAAGSLASYWFGNEWIGVYLSWISFN